LKGAGMVMKMFCAVRHSNDPRLFYGGLWSSNFYPALRQLGCEIVESQTDLLPTSRFMAIAQDFTPEELAMRAQTTERIVDEVREAKRQGPVHLFLGYFYNAHFDPAGFEEIRQLGIPSVNFYCNSIHQFELVATIAAHVDFSWHPEREARPAYLSVGANPIRVQMGADPRVYRPVNGIERHSKVCFVGQRYADRDRWLAALVEANIPVDIYGVGWGVDNETHAGRVPEVPVYLGRRHVTPGTLASYFQLVTKDVRQHGVFGAIGNLAVQATYRHETRRLAHVLRSRAKGKADDLARVFGAYEVNLNFSNVWAEGRPGSPLISHVRLRDFEVPMCRTCYLTGHSDEITEFYGVGNEIDTYCEESELVDKARFYLANPDAAEKLREAGYRRAIRDHTWKHRFEELFAKIGLNVTHL
jgi:spore maturation protein CgeB